MIYIILLFVFNIAIIIVLSTTGSSNVSDIFTRKISPILRLKNIDASIEDIEINKYHSIFKNMDDISGEKYE